MSVIERCACPRCNGNGCTRSGEDCVVCDATGIVERVPFRFDKRIGRYCDCGAMSDRVAAKADRPHESWCEALNPRTEGM